MRLVLALALALAVTPAAARPVTVAVAPGATFGYDGARWARAADDMHPDATYLTYRGKPTPSYPSGMAAYIVARPRGAGTPVERIERHLAVWSPEAWPNVRATGRAVRSGGVWRVPFSTAGGGAETWEEGVIGLAEAGDRDVLVLVTEAYGPPTDKVVAEALAGLHIRR